MEYTFDLISGNVHEVRYQPGEADQYTHRYTYDADNRIVDVYTSKVATANWTTAEVLPGIYQSGDGEDGIGFDHDAHYIYYDHGPLARVELGDNQVQGIDYAYNLQGWLKGTNSAALSTDKDMGRDSDFATTESANKFFAKDVASFNLNYFEGDYSAIDDNTWLPTYAASANILSNRKDLWNGNIGMMQTNLTPTAGHENDPGAGILGMVYQYDQLNRIKDAQGYMNFTGGEWQANSAPENMYRNQFTYDANGNILSQRRADREEHFFDELTYNYNSDNGKVHQNRLYSVDDIGTASLYADDFEDQDAFVLNNINSTNNYSYTEIGELKSDKAEKIDEIIWRVDSKISEVNRTTESGKNNLKFDYDAMGNRVAKYIYTENALHIWELTKTIYYLRDASGNVMAVYELTSTPANPGNNTLGETSMKVTERHIYGSSRLGMDVQSVELIDQEVPLLDTSQFRILGLKQYEISNHLGNVLSVISDVKLPVENNSIIESYVAVVISATDYSPFGVGLYERSWSAPEYRYGFNGKEKDDEFSGEGNSYDFGARIYDGRLGRWLSVDPLYSKYPNFSPYCYTANAPILFIDHEGKDIAIKDPDTGKIYTWTPGDVPPANGWVAETYKTLQYLYDNGGGMAMNVMDNLVGDNSYIVTIAQNANFDLNTEYQPANNSSDNTIAWNSHMGIIMGEEGKGNHRQSAPIIQLIHELGHAEKHCELLRNLNIQLADGDPLKIKEAQKLLNEWLGVDESNNPLSPEKINQIIAEEEARNLVLEKSVAQALGMGTRKDYNDAFQIYKTNTPYTAEKSYNVSKKEMRQIRKINRSLEKEFKKSSIGAKIWNSRWGSVKAKGEEIKK
jgi:RHS repeat-associated protein